MLLLITKQELYHRVWLIPLHSFVTEMAAKLKLRERSFCQNFCKKVQIQFLPRTSNCLWSRWHTSVIHGSLGTTNVSCECSLYLTVWESQECGQQVLYLTVWESQECRHQVLYLTVWESQECGHQVLYLTVWESQECGHQVKLLLQLVFWPGISFHRTRHTRFRRLARKTYKLVRKGHNTVLTTQIRLWNTAEFYVLYKTFHKYTLQDFHS